MKLNLKKGPYDATSVLAGVVAGLAIGGGSAWLVCDRALTRRFEDRLDQEVADLKTHYNDRLKEALSDAISFVPEAGAPFVGQPERDLDLARASGDPIVRETAVGAGAEVAEFDPLEGLDDGEEDADADGDNYDPEEADADGTGGLLRADQAVAPAVDRNIDHPYVISLEEFSESPPGWQQITLKYFAGDKIPTLVDDKNEPIPNYHKIVGKIRGNAAFGGISGDPNLLYVRNQEHETDYEICFDPRSYAEAVLNYGQPNKER